jgi:hypothetical protein
VALRGLHDREGGTLMPAGGFADYARLMQSLPGTANQIAKRTGMGDSGVRRLVRAFWTLGLVHPGGKKAAGAMHPCEAIWMPGDGPPAEGLRVQCPLRPRPQHIAFKYLWNALCDGATKHELRDLTGLSEPAIRHAMRAIDVRIVEYEFDSRGRPVAVWQAGKGPNKPRPVLLSEGGKWRRYQQRKAWRVLAQQGVVV